MFSGKKHKPIPEDETFAPVTEEEVVPQSRRTSRWVWRTIWYVVIIAIIGSVYFLGKSTLDLVLEKVIYTNNMFTVRNIEVRTIGGLSNERVLEFLGVEAGKDNLMALSLGDIKERLERVSVIERASVERSLPDVLKVSVYARIPIMRCYVWETDPLTLTNGSWGVRYLDEQGYVMVPDDLFYEVHAPERLLLPTLTGVSDKNILVPNRLCGDRQVLEALKFLRLYRESAFYGKDNLEEVNISEKGFLIARTAEHVEAVFDENALELGLARWEAIKAYGAKTNLNVKTIDVSVTNNVAVTWQNVPQTNAVAGSSKKEKSTERR